VQPDDPGIYYHLTWATSKITKGQLGSFAALAIR
jgi:hypothetical protein